MKQIILILLLCFLTTQITLGNESSILLQKGWSELVKDNDVAALKYFALAHTKAVEENDLENSANALLNMGICSYGSSLSQGLHYCLRAMAEFKKLEKAAPQKRP